MTRLRRSLRATAPAKLTQEERYEKLISYVMEGNYSETLRQFNMPTYILASLQSGESNASKSALEVLPTDILLEIINKLTGNDQIMAALACKTIAAVVETSTIRKIANITYYNISTKDPAYKGWNLYAYRFLEEIDSEDKTPTSESWRQLGFNEHAWRYWWSATGNQYQSMQSAVSKWLGPKCRFCQICRKFRTIQKTFWRNLAEYENPGITKKSSKKSCERVKRLIDSWNDMSESSAKHLRLMVCPAHELLRERRGKRLIKAS